jgi:glycosyltransferase involved in cell wall biosynthesis
MSIKIAFVQSTPLHPYHGENIRSNFLLDLMIKKGFDIDLILPKHKIIFKKNINYYISDIEVDRFNKYKEIQHLKFGLQSLSFTKKLKKGYNVIYSFGLSGSLLAYKLSKRKIPVIFDFYEVDFPEFRRSKNIFIKTLLTLTKIHHKRTFLKSNKVIVLSNKLRGYVTNKYGIIPEVIYDAADRRLFNEKVRKKHNKFTFSFHGGIEKRDGILNLLKAAKMLAKKYDFKLFIIGDGCAKKDCELFVKRNSELKDKVNFTGWVDYNKMPLFISQVDIGIIPNLKIPINELTISRKIFEYMGCGIPMIISDFQVIHEILDYKDSIFVEPGNVEEIYKAMDFCINKKKQLDKMSKLLLSKSKKINLQISCKKLLNIIEETARK